MAAADAPSRSPSTPEACAHPAPVVGVMAHEFAHYAGAKGPEGSRRTVTYYGPVIGGLPIQAWHCVACGMLRLVYPDGRKEERGLFPGPQPGLLVEATTVSPDAQYFGMQPRVSGLTVSSDLLAQIAIRDVRDDGDRRGAMASLKLPNLGVATWIVVALLTLLAAGLPVAGVLVTYDWTTPDVTGPFTRALAGTFGVAFVLFIAAAAWRHFGPAEPLAPSVAVSGRGAARLDGGTRLVVALLAITTAGLAVAGILAVYDWTTPAAVGPLFVVTATAGTLSLAAFIVSAILRRRRRRP